MFKYRYLFCFLICIPSSHFGQQKYGADIDILISKADSLYYAQNEEAAEQYFLKAETLLE